MHQSVREFVSRYPIKGRILEIGSYDVNGSVRDLFPDTDYLGIDMREGKGVDRVMNGAKLDFDDASFDGVLYLETMEHDKTFWLTLAEISRVLKKGGRLIITARGIGFPLHDYPGDYYRFTKQFFEDLEGYQDKIVIDDPQYSGVFFTGLRDGQRKTF
jgi:SAM-dependent methyltransferase